MFLLKVKWLAFKGYKRNASTGVDERRYKVLPDVHTLSTNVLLRIGPIVLRGAPSGAGDHFLLSSEEQRIEASLSI